MARLIAVFDNWKDFVHLGAPFIEAAPTLFNARQVQRRIYVYLLIDQQPNQIDNDIICAMSERYSQNTCEDGAIELSNK